MLICFNHKLDTPPVRETQFNYLSIRVRRLETHQSTTVLPTRVSKEQFRRLNDVVAVRCSLWPTMLCLGRKRDVSFSLCDIKSLKTWTI